MAQRGARGRWLVLGALLLVAALARWRLAELASWGIDEAANLWLGSLILGGEAPRLGLVSSRGIPNLAGVPLLAAPLARLPDLLSISRVLSLAQLAVLAALALVIARGGRGRLVVVAALIFCPAAVLASTSLWNQYMALPVTAAITATLLWLVEQPADAPQAPLGLDATVLLAALLLLQPALHLAGFADLAAQGAIALGLVGVGARRARRLAIDLGLAIAAAAAFALYGPWLTSVFTLSWRGAVALYLNIALAIVLTMAAIEGRLAPLARRVGESRTLAWSVPALLAACAIAVVIAFPGAQASARLLADGSWGAALLAAEVALAAIALPALPGMIADCRAGCSLRALLGNWFGDRRNGAALLLANAGLLLAARVALEPAALRSEGRPDLLLPLLPALLAPSLLLAVTTTRAAIRATAALAAGSATAAIVALAVAGGDAGMGEPHFLPATEMRAVVDWIAAQPEAIGADGQLDVGYDLGREELVRIACSPITSWYTQSRPFDWLFVRRHGLRDRRDGECDRASGGRLLVTYRAAPAPPDRALRLALPHLAVWSPVDSGPRE